MGIFSDYLMTLIGVWSFFCKGNLQERLLGPDWPPYRPLEAADVTEGSAWQYRMQGWIWYAGHVSSSVASSHPPPPPPLSTGTPGHLHLHLHTSPPPPPPHNNLFSSFLVFFPFPIFLFYSCLLFCFHFISLVCSRFLHLYRLVCLLFHPFIHLFIHTPRLPPPPLTLPSPLPPPPESWPSLCYPELYHSLTLYNFALFCVVVVVVFLYIFKSDPVWYGSAHSYLCIPVRRVWGFKERKKKKRQELKKLIVLYWFSIRKISQFYDNSVMDFSLSSSTVRVTYLLWLVIQLRVWNLKGWCELKS